MSGTSAAPEVVMTNAGSVLARSRGSNAWVSLLHSASGLEKRAGGSTGTALQPDSSAGIDNCSLPRTPLRRRRPHLKIAIPYRLGRTYGRLAISGSATALSGLPAAPARGRGK